MPTGTGVWPAMWMLPNDSRYGSWPLSGEIDVFEGRGRTPDMVFGTLHYGAQWPNNINTSDVFNMVQDGKKKTGIADWHVYSVVWDAEIIKYTVTVSAILNAHTGNGIQAQTEEMPMHLLTRDFI